MRTTDFQESLRYDYPLTPDSMVIDLGAHVGSFAAGIYEKFKCYVQAYEPVSEFYDKAQERLAPYKPKVKLFKASVGPRETQIEFGVKGSMSGSFTQGNYNEVVQMWDISSVVKMPVDLIKINIEGGEFDLLDAILDRELHLNIRNIQVQFHSNVPNPLERWQEINRRLLETHELTYYFPFCWENYARI